MAATSSSLDEVVVAELRSIANVTKRLSEAPVRAGMGVGSLTEPTDAVRRR